MSSTRRTLVASCAAHALHDGYTELIYLLLPIWRTELGIGYAMLAVLRGFYGGAMAGLQIPSGHLAGRIGARATLAIGTVVAAVGYLFAGVSGGIVGLAGSLVVLGAGSSVQHPIGSSAVSRAYQPTPRTALGTYNFSGDIGKAAVPAFASLLLAFMSWRSTVSVVAVLGIGMAGVIALLMPRASAMAKAPSEDGSAKARVSGAPPQAGLGGFRTLLAIGILDTSVRMGLLTFLPFVLARKGANVSVIGTSLALLFIGGASGKFLCGWLGARFGMLRTILLTEGGTAAFILAMLAVPLVPAMVLMPILGAMLNGTSSVLYGTVPELVPSAKVERAFAIFYTGILGAGSLSPVLFGVVGDALGPTVATIGIALSALLTIPLAFRLPVPTETRPSAP